MEKQTIYMMIGIPGAGKSRFYALGGVDYGTHQYISSDEIRWEMYLKDDPDYSKVDNQKVFQQAHKEIKEALDMGDNVVFDATNLNKKSRAHFIRTFSKVADIVGFVFVTPVEHSMGVMKERLLGTKGEDAVRVVPPHKLEQMYHGFQIPTLQEGFKELVYCYTEQANWPLFETWLKKMLNVRSVNGLKKQFNADLNPLISTIRGYDQNNKYHTLTLDKHTEGVLCGFYETLTENKYLLLAGAFHDIGKLTTRSEGKDGLSHYYNHENQSAYIFIMNCYKPLLDLGLTKVEINDIIWLISNHMGLLKNQGEKLEKEDPRMYKHLVDFNKADREAH